MNETRVKLERAVNWNIFEIQAALVIATDSKMEPGNEEEDQVTLNENDVDSLKALMKAAERLSLYIPAICIISDIFFLFSPYSLLFM